jgi:hypothetical protein
MLHAITSQGLLGFPLAGAGRGSWFQGFWVNNGIAYHILLFLVPPSPFRGAWQIIMGVSKKVHHDTLG